MGDFNPDGDNTMSVVYKIAKFGENNDSNEISTPINHSSPKMKNQATANNQQLPNSSKIFKTDTEKRMERLRQQLDNPITLSDIKTKQGFRQYNNNTQKTQSGPKQKSQSADNSNNIQQPEPINIRDLQRILQQRNKSINNQQDNAVFKTDTEKGVERLRQQLDNPVKIDLNQIPRK